MIHTQPFISSQYKYLAFSLCTWGVPYFFVMSSYFYYKNGENPKFFKRIILLYAVWFIIELPLVYLRFFHNDNTIEMNMKKFLWGLLTGSTFPVSWYLMALLEGVFILKVLQRRFGNLTLVFIAVLFYSLCLLSSSYSFMIECDVWNSINETIRFGNSFFVGIIYLTIGKILAESIEGKVSFSPTILLILLVLSIILWCLEIYWVQDDFINTGCFITLPLLTMVVASLSLKLSVRLNDSLLHLFRKASTLIYLSHPVVIFILSRFFGMECGVFLFVVTFTVSGLFAISINTLSYRFKLLKYLY